MSDGFIKVGDQQRKIVDVYTKVNDQWRKVTDISSKVKDEWRLAWKNSFPAPAFATIPASITRGQTITWSAEDIPGAHYEYQRKYNTTDWGTSAFFTKNSGQVTVTDNIGVNSLQIRVRAVAPITHDKESTWVYSPIRSVQAAKLPKPTGLSYASSITRGDKIRVSFTIADKDATYYVYARYKDGSKTWSGTAWSGKGAVGKKTFDYETSASTGWDTIQFTVKAERTGYHSSDELAGPLCKFNNQKLGTPGSISRPSKPYVGQRITISWKGVSKAQKYQLEVQTNNGSFSRVYWGSNTSYSMTVPNKDNIDFRVRATANGYDDSNWRDVDQVNIQEPPLKVTTWTATSTKSWRPNYGGQWMPMDDYMYQGSWVEDGVLWGNYTGMAFFNYNSIKNTLEGKKIEKVRIYMYRINRGGYVSGQSVNLYTHNYASRPSDSSRPSMSHLQGPMSSYARGEGKWITVSTELAKRFVNGSAKGIGLYRSDGTRYVYMSSNVKIEVSYR